MYIYMYIYISTHIYICIFIFQHTYIYIYVYLNIYIYTCIYICLSFTVYHQFPTIRIFHSGFRVKFRGGSENMAQDVKYLGATSLHLRSFPSRRGHRCYWMQGKKANVSTPSSAGPS